MKTQKSSTLTLNKVKISKVSSINTRKMDDNKSGTTISLFCTWLISCP
ncbi:MAG: hypothetical protein ACEPOV_06500 [Hyphomicrobiales bacterium]